MATFTMHISSQEEKCNYCLESQQSLSGEFNVSLERVEQLFEKIASDENGSINLWVCRPDQRLLKTFQADRYLAEKAMAWIKRVAL